MKIKVGVLFGGKTVEHEISIISAIQAMGYLNREFGRNASKVCDFVVLVGEKQAVPIKAGLLQENYSEKKSSLQTI